jgi:asparagine synthase (glutamine-hydrolysing)
MCGINCIVRFDNLDENDHSNLLLMNEVMFHRGPDDSGLFIDKCVGLAMRRLSVVDLETGSQPIYSNCKKFVIVFNGEVFNHKEIRNDLKTKGYIFNSETDTEVVLNCFMEYGAECVRYFKGMYAFIIYNIENNEINIFRDANGIKPLYYAFKKNFFVASSSLDSILAIEDFPVSRNSIFQYLTFGFIPCPSTIYFGIKKLPAGAHMKIELNTGNVITTEIVIEDLVLPFSKEKFRSEFKEDINDQFDLEVSHALFLSGGIDSNAILAEAPLCMERRKSLTVKFEDGFDETDLAELNSKKYLSDLNKYTLMTKDVVPIVNKLVASMDEPIADPSSVPTFFLASKAKEDGIKVAFSGAGGDEIFGGYHRHMLPKWRLYLHKFGFIYNLPLLNRLKSQKLLRLLNWRYDYVSSISGLNVFGLEKLMTDSTYTDFRSCVNERLKVHLNSNSLESKLDFDRHVYLVDNILALTDKMSMANSIEVRVPFANYRYFGLSADEIDRSNRKLSCLKSIQKEIFRSALDDKIIAAPKKGFIGPTEKFIKGNWDRIRTTLSASDNLVFNQIFKSENFENIHYRDYNFNVIWSIYLLKKWLEARNIRNLV